MPTYGIRVKFTYSFMRKSNTEIQCTVIDAMREI